MGSVHTPDLIALSRLIRHRGDAFGYSTRRVAGIVEEREKI